MPKNQLTVAEATDLISKSKQPGFRKANKKLLREAETIVRQDFVDRGNDFMKRYQALCKETRIEIKARFEPVQGMPENIAKAGLMLAEYKEKEKPNTKPWSEAAAENLDLRKKCEHVLNAEGNVCEKCGAAPQNWHESGVGVTEQYERESLDRIKEWQKEEAEKDAEDTATSGEAAEGTDK